MASFESSMAFYFFALGVQMAVVMLIVHAANGYKLMDSSQQDRDNVSEELA